MTKTVIKKETVSSKPKKPSKNYTCFILRRFELFLIHLQSKKETVLRVYTTDRQFTYQLTRFGHSAVR